MKTQHIFPGITLLGFGLYFLLEQTKITLFDGFFSWPTLLCIVGIAFLGQAYAAKTDEAILPGVILFGFGLHFHVVDKLEIWPNHTGIFLLIIAFGLLLRARKTHSDMFQSILMFIVSIVTLYYDTVITWLGLTKIQAIQSGTYWPYVLIAIGVYVLFMKRKK